MRTLLLILGFLLTAKGAHSNQAVHGMISDADSGAPLPHANIYLQGTTIGTTSNKDGNFSLEIPAYPAIIVVSYIGYETREIPVSYPQERRLDVALKPIVIQMERVVVTGDREDPAVGIMRQVIASKGVWKRGLKSYRAKAYTRTVVENDTVIVSLSESLSRLYWHAEYGSREEFHARKCSKQLPYLTNTNLGSKNILNFYEDELLILEHRFVGPTHADAFHFYNFRLAGIRSLDDRKVFDIDVIPRSRLQPLFSGRIAVLDGDFAILEVNLKNSGAFSFATMIEDFQGCYRQQFNNFGGDFWLPIDSRTEESLTLNMGLIAFPRARLRKISRISHYEVNLNIEKEIARIDSSSAEKNLEESQALPGEFEAFLKVPLTEAESRLYSHPDTSLTLVEAFRPRGLMAPYLIKREKDIETAMRETGEYNPIKSRGRLGYETWYNRVEGLHLGLSYRRPLLKRFRWKILSGYQTAARGFFSETSIRWNLDPRYSRFLELSFEDRIKPRIPSSHYGQTIASLLPLFGYRDYFDYYRNRSVTTRLHWHWPRFHSRVDLELLTERHGGVKKNTDWKLLGAKITQRPNPSVEHGRLNAVRLRFAFDDADDLPEIARMAGLVYANRFSLAVEYDPEWIRDDFDFARIEAMFDVTLSTFFRRRQYPNHLRVRAEGGAYRGSLPLQRFSAIDGLFFSYAPFGVFKTSINRALEGEKKLGIFWEHNFKSVPFEMLGLKFTADQQWEFLIHGAHGRTWIDTNRLQELQNATSIGYWNRFHHELGISLRMKYYFMALRLDVTHNLDNQKYVFSFNLNLIGMTF